jgi:hypothetical protein
MFDYKDRCSSPKVHRDPIRCCTDMPLQFEVARSDRYRDGCSNMKEPLLWSLVLSLFCRLPWLPNCVPGPVTHKRVDACVQRLAARKVSMYECLTAALDVCANDCPAPDGDRLDGPFANYTYPLSLWLNAFPRDQVHVLQVWAYRKCAAPDLM